MANRAYLCTSVSKILYPSSKEPGYDAKKQTVAESSYSIPLLWLAAFRTSDIQSVDIKDEDGNTFHVMAPLSTVDQACENIDSSLKALSSIFRGQPNLPKYVDVFKVAIRERGFPYITIELSELEYMDEPSSFRNLLKTCIKGFEDPTVKRSASVNDTSFLGSLFGRTLTIEQDWKQCLVELTTLQPEHTFPSPTIFSDGSEFTEADAINLSRLLGNKWLSPTPWEN